MSKDSRIDLDIIESQLKGKTLLVYWFMLRSPGSKVGVRQVQRALGFSSPSVASYHLDKLRSLRLVGNLRGDYFLKEDVKVGVLKFFTRLGRFLVPRYLFYSVFFSTMLIVYLILYGHSGGIHNVIAVLFGVLACSILWFETLKLWRERPI